MSLLLTGAHVATMDDADSELEAGWILVSEGLIDAVGSADPPEADDRLDLDGVAHCPTSNLRLGAGVAPVRELVDAGARVGLGVDGSASNERSDLFFEVKQALLVARARGGPAAMTARDAQRLGTRGGAAVLGRDDIGSIEPGKRADLAVWRTDSLELGGAADPVAGLVFSAPHRADRLYVGGVEVVQDGHLVNADEEEIAREHRAQAARVTAGC